MSTAAQLPGRFWAVSYCWAILPWRVLGKQHVFFLKTPVLLYNYFLGKTSFLFSAPLQQSLLPARLPATLLRGLRCPCLPSSGARVRLLRLALFFKESLQYVQRLREFPLFFSMCPPLGLQTHTLCCFDVISSKYFATKRQCRVTEVLQAWASGFQPSPVNNGSLTR